MFHPRICICAVQQFLRSTFRLRLPIQLRNAVTTTIVQKFLKILLFITYIFPQSSYNPTFSYVLLYKFIQLYIKVRGDLVPTFFLHCIIIFLIDSSMFSLMAIYSRNM